MSDRPDKRELRRFALTMAIAIAVVFGLVLPWLWDRPWPRLPWLIAGVFALLGGLTPMLLRPLFHAWMRVGHVLGAINTRILLGIAFFVLMVPVGLLMRAFGRDPMRRRREPEAVSYRQPSARRSPDHFRKPF